MIDFFNILIYILYSIVFLIIIYFISKHKIYSNFNFMLLSVFFLFICTLNIFNELFGFLPHFADSTFYTLYISSDYVNEELYSFSLGYKTTYYISFLFKYFFLKSPLLYLIFQKFILVISILLLWKAIQNIVLFKYYLNKYELIQLQKIYLFIILLYPALSLYTSALLRDYITILLSSLWLLGISYFLSNHKKISIIYFIISIIGFYYIRYQFILIILISLFFITFIKINNKKIKYTVLPIISTFGIIIGYIFLKMIGYAHFLTPSGFSYIRNIRQEQFSDSGQLYGTIEFSSYIDILIYIPLYILQFLFSPMPILTNNSPFSYVLGSLDSLYVIILFIFIYIYKQSIRKDKLISTLLIIFIITIVPSALFEFYLSGAIRHRIPYILLLIIPASILIWKKKYKIRIKNG